MPNQFKANLTLVKRHWQHKVVGRQLSIKDSLEPRFCNDMTTWIPKLTPKYPKPCTFFHIGNKNSSAYFRTTLPILADTLEQISITLRSDLWLDKWERIQDVSSELIDNELFLDADYLDMDLFNRDILARQK
jgi:hypothetical protein